MEVREDAHMFWWLMRAGNGTTSDFKNFPLVIWLEGGPGSSSTGFSNFRMIGPLALDDGQHLSPRNQTWLNHANLLFIDSPVGAGFSYVTRDEAFTVNNQQIAQDLLSFFKTFLHLHPDFETVPLVVAGESYGGKMAVSFVKELHAAIERKEVRANLDSLVLADASVSPFDACSQFSTYLHALSMIDSQQKEQIDRQVEKIREEMEGKSASREATWKWIELREMIETATFGVNWDNVMQAEQPYPHLKNKILADNQTKSLPIYQNNVSPEPGQQLNQLMNGVIRSKLGIIPDSVTWGRQKSKVFDHLTGDFMYPVVSEVEYLLNSTDVKVFVYSGQMDLVGNALGTEAWINSMNWSRLPDFQKSRRMLFAGSVGHPKGYIKSLDNLTVFWIMDAGHLVPMDQPELALKMLRHILATSRESASS